MEEALFRILQAKRAIPIQHSGPRALYDATDRFLHYNVTESRHLEGGKLYQHTTIDNNSKTRSNQSRSFRVLPVGSAANNAFQKEKGEAYKLMNMTHYTQQQANQRNKKNGGGKNKGGNKKPYDGKTCLAFLDGKMLYPENYQGGASATSQD
ncbi:MAG: hypothetical protein SGARI_007498, partial [Bacillariaceae sp.]